MVDTRMMSEEEVKAEKYRKHFDKMVRYFSSYVKLFIANLNNKTILFNLWNTHFASLIKITQYAETRSSIYRLVRKSIERTYVNMVRDSKAENLK